MTYQAESGMYYDHDSGYYWDPVQHMYYDGSSGYYLRWVYGNDVNRKPKIWYTKKIPIPNRYLVFMSQISYYFLGILSVS